MKIGKRVDSGLAVWLFSGLDYAISSLKLIVNRQQLKT